MLEAQMANSLRLGDMEKPKASEVPTKIIGISEIRNGKGLKYRIGSIRIMGKHKTCLLKLPSHKPEVLIANGRV